MGVCQLRISRVDYEGKVCICVPTWRISKAESVQLRCRIEKMRAFHFLYLKIQEDFFEYHGLFDFTPRKTQQLAIRINKIIEQIQNQKEE